MSDGAKISTCFQYFLCCPRPCLTRAKYAKIDEDDLTTGSIRVRFIGGIFV